MENTVGRKETIQSSSSNAVRFSSFTSSTTSSTNPNQTDSHGASNSFNILNENGNGSKDIDDRIVLVRYYLDRPGYDLSNSSSRLWINPPVPVTPNDVLQFLHDEGIKSKDDEGDASRNLLVELFLDAYQTFMLLEACNDYSIHFDFSDATAAQPGMLNIRLTDLNEAAAASSNQNPSGANNSNTTPPRCNTSPVGLFAFAMTVGLDALNVLRLLTEGESSTLNASYLLILGPYAFFVSGLLQFVVGLNEISRNNIYGATVFIGFGCFWLANGSHLILNTYFPEQIPVDIQSSPLTATANFVRECYIMIFACALFKQTLAMNKVTTGLMGTTIIYVLAASLGGWHDAFLWMKMAFGFVLSVYSLFVFYAELTNEVYHRTVIDLYPWTVNSSEEAFGTAGRVNGLIGRAINLRTAGHHDVLLVGSFSKNTVPEVANAMPTMNSPSAYHLRDVRPENSK